MSFAYAIDPSTGDFILDDDGQPVVTTDPSPELLLAVGVPVGRAFADPELGSRIPSFVSGGRTPKANDVETAARDALTRIEAAGLVTVEAITFDAEERELLIETAELADPVTIPL